jgi:hypothetical protein
LVTDVLLLKKKYLKIQATKGILILSYVDLVQEKIKWLRKLVDVVTNNIDVSIRRDATGNPRLQ